MQKEKAEPLPKEVDVENNFKASYISRKIKDPVEFCVDHSTFPRSISVKKLSLLQSYW